MKNHQLVVAQWLEQIGNERGISLSLEGGGLCVIPCSGELNCVVEVPADIDVPTVFIYQPLIQLPEGSGKQLDLTCAALEMNLFGLLTGGCQLALDSRSNYLVLSYSSLIDAIHYSDFRNILYDMLEQTPRLLQRLNMVVNQPSMMSELLLHQNRYDRFVPASEAKK